MKNEIWRTITGFPKYQVSDRGRVKSNWKKRLPTGIRIPFVRILKTSVRGAGYLQVKLFISPGRGRAHSVHRLVVEAFQGKIDDGLTVDHVDGDKTNNKLENLELVTHAENVRRYWKQGGRHG